MIKYRYTKSTDIDGIMEMIKITNPDFVEESMKTIKDRMLKEQILCCTFDNKIVGILGWSINYNNNLNYWFLEQITIHPEYRNKGIGKDFVDYFINICKENKVKKMFGRIDESNIKSQKMFSKVIGFKINTDLDKKVDNEITFEFDL